jgi:hypothetical protein
MRDGMRNQTAWHRRVLARIGLGGAVLIAAVAGGRRAAALKPAGGKAGAHYKESEHVKQYYRVNRY